MDEKNKIPGVSFIKRNIGTIIGLILLVIIVSISTPKFLTSSNILNLLKSNSVNAIISCGMLLAILMGEIDISVGSTVGLSGIIGAYMITNVGLPVVPTVLICLGVGALVGIVNGVAISYLKVPAFVATLATQSIGRGLTEIISGGVTIRVRNTGYTALGNQNVAGISIIIIYAAAVLIFTWFLLNRTRFGYYIYALGGNKLAAQYSGVNVKKYNMLPYVLIGLFCGLSGLIWSARLGSAAATLGSGFEMDAIAAVVIGGTSMSGGVGTVGGTFIGILIIGVITNGLNLMGINSFWQEVYERMQKLGTTMQRIAVTGGGAASELTLQIRADVFGMEVDSLESAEAGTLGCMLMAATAVGAYSSMEEAIKKTVRIKKRYIPDSDMTSYYRKKFENYKHFYEEMHDFH